MIRILSFLLFFIPLYACGQKSIIKKHTPDPAAKKLLDSAYTFIINGNDYKNSIPLINEAIQIDSNYANPYNFKLSYEWELKQYDSCIKTVNSLIRLNPNNADSYAQLGILYYFKKDNSLSKNYFNEAVNRYNKVLDTMSSKNYQYNFYLMNKAFYLVFLDRQKEGNELIQNIVNNEEDKNLKSYYSSFLNKSKEEILEQLQGKANSTKQVGN